MPDRKTRRERKDRLVQTRVPRDLEQTLKEEAARRRLTVSHLIRNVLEDAFDLVDGVVADVDRIVADSVSLARSLGRETQRATRRRRGAAAGEPATPAEPGDDLSHVYAWNEVVLHRPAECSGCGRELKRGQHAHAGLSDEPSAPRAWLCEACIAALAS